VAAARVTLTVTGGAIGGIHSGAVLNEAGDFSAGVADLTAQGMTLTGDAGGSDAVTITVPEIGEAYWSGVVAHILQDGDPRYVDGETHGLVVAQADQSTAIGTGRDNTNAIVSQNGAGSSTYAAGLCYKLTTGGYSDWYLPSKDELSKLYLNRSAIGMTANAWYWSSSEYAFSATDEAWGQVFPNGSQAAQLKSTALRVRAVRSF